MTNTPPADKAVAGRRVAMRCWWTVAGVATLLAVHAILALSSTARRSVTTDEIFHVTGGYLFDTVSDFRIHPENGILPQRLHGLAAVLMGARPPPMTDNQYWKSSDTIVVSHQFFYESGNDHWPILIAARAINLGFALGICILVFSWARALAGNVAGFTALGLSALSPTLLAHGPLATSDAAASLMLAASSAAFWWQLRGNDWRRTALSAAVFALACVSKYSAVLLIPIFLLLAVIHVFTGSPWQRAWPRIAAGLGAHAVIAYAVIWACCGFRYSAFAPSVSGSDHLVMPWGTMLQRAGWQGPVLTWLREWKLLPEAFIYGYTHSYTGSLTRAAFLAGEYSVTGWRSFFPLAFLWKSTPSELGGALLAIVTAGLGLRRAREWLVRLAPLVVMLAVYGLAALTSNLNIGHRHILPLYPLVFILIGIAVSRLRRARVAAAGFVGAQLASTLMIFPHYIAYFNTAAGGPANGWRLLVDSSLDWGQDLPALAEWVRRNNSGPAAQPLYLSYFGSGEPAYYGIPATRMLTLNLTNQPLRWYEPRGGVYAISATMLQQVYSPVRGAWTLELEREYQDLRKYEPYFRDYHEQPSRRSELLTLVSAEQWERAWHRFEVVRFARLSAYLRARGPDESIGYSILIFKLSDREVNTVVRGPFSAWQSAVEDAKSHAPAR